jgi:hypothetical protein
MTDRPQEPDLSDFGLSNAQIRYFEDTNFPFQNCLFWFSVVLAGIIYFGLYRFTNKNAIFGLVGLFIFWVIPVFLNKSCERWVSNRRKQNTDYPKYLKYKEAYSSYKSALFKFDQEEEKKKRMELKWWMNLDGHAFEREFTALLKRKGYSAHNTRHSGDEGVDIYAEKDNTSIIIQCKAHKRYISPATVRELYGTLTHKEADEAWLVVTSGFTVGATAFVEGKPIRLFTIKDFL